MNTYRLYYQNYPFSSEKHLAKADSAAGKALLCRGLSDAFGLDCNHMEIIHGPHGKPYFKDYPNLFFNLSHSHGLAAAAFAPFEIGLDLEYPRTVSDSLIQKVCTKEEQSALTLSSDISVDFCRIWTKKESYLKLTGDGITVALNTLKIPDCVIQETFPLQSGHILTVSYYQQ